ncbi:MAG TPA: pirin family protein [Acidiferrobacteraceae bacterium]|nr:pirin family protein [Acidiferrobacteraceae bacterium]
MSSIIHRSESRGSAEHGWLHSRHSFSFADYYNPERMGFGKLRVLNDDVVEAKMGFGTHPHNNMEIVSIPLSGSLHHQDSMGSTQQIHAGEVQIMSAGTGLTHSEYNGSDSEQVNFLQIWILPRHLNIKPRYEQMKFESATRQNRFQLVVSPDGDEGSLIIKQDVWFSLADLDIERSVDYSVHQHGHGIYFFVINGEVKIDDDVLSSRDAMGVTDASIISIQALSTAQLLAIEVPMG